MGRRPRMLLAGGIYHVYNRVSRGEHVFRDDGEAERFEALLAATKKRDALVPGTFWHLFGKSIETHEI